MYIFVLYKNENPQRECFDPIRLFPINLFLFLAESNSCARRAHEGADGTACANTR